jgi:ribosomal protein S14
MRYLIILPALLMLSACATTGQPSAAMLKQEATEAKRLDEALAGFVPGATTSCIDVRAVQGPESFGENTLIFRQSRNLVYKTQTRGSCERVGQDRALITRIYGSKLCRGDTAQSADLPGGYTSGFCVMGDFVAYRRPKQAKG